MPLPNLFPRTKALVGYQQQRPILAEFQRFDATSKLTRFRLPDLGQAIHVMHLDPTAVGQGEVFGIGGKSKSIDLAALFWGGINQCLAFFIQHLHITHLLLAPKIVKRVNDDISSTLIPIAPDDAALLLPPAIDHHVFTLRFPVPDYIEWSWSALKNHQTNVSFT